ncbi:MAG: hypothetical protein GWN29_11525, partial [Gammaproteobacteria bacterium]|nr:hypothetical protein [Gammaproteobacteria bacterium]
PSPLPNEMYLNENGRFSQTPVWTSSLAAATYSVQLADVDGDGDLDLVCANQNSGNTLYVNTGGTFSAAPVWVSATNYDSRRAELGDIDGDGDLDLACGNFAQPNTLYENIGGTFTTLPVWQSADSSQTWSIALGDMNGDGALDLVSANWNQRNQGRDAHRQQRSALACGSRCDRNGHPCVERRDPGSFNRNSSSARRSSHRSVHSRRGCACGGWSHLVPKRRPAGVCFQTAGTVLRSLQRAHSRSSHRGERVGVLRGDREQRHRGLRSTGCPGRLAVLSGRRVAEGDRNQPGSNQRGRLLGRAAHPDCCRASEWRELRLRHTVRATRWGRGLRHFAHRSAGRGSRGRHCRQPRDGAGRRVLGRGQHADAHSHRSSKSAAECAEIDP